MTCSRQLLLLDVGGTFIKCSDGREIPIDSNGPRGAVCAAFAEAVGPFIAACSPAVSSGDGAALALDVSSSVGFATLVAGIAVAMPGPFDYAEGRFLMKHKFASVYGENFRDVAGIPDFIDVRYTHDVNGMLNGEMAYGNGRGYSRVAMVTLGTGLGFSMYVDGKVLKNDYGSPLVSIFNRPFRDGVLEDYASKRGFLATYARLLARENSSPVSSSSDVSVLPADFTVREIGCMAAEGDPLAIETFAEVGSIIATSIAPILKEYGIECLLFGGQISRSFRFMSNTVSDGLSDVQTLRTISVISDFDNATFNGLRSLFE